MKYVMPEEPDVEKVVDKCGFVWTRELNNVQNYVWRSSNGGLRKWSDLLRWNGPLEDFVQKYNVVFQKNNGLVSAPGDTSIYERDLTKEQAQRMINSFLGTAPLSLVLKFERNVMLKRKHDGYVYTYMIEEV